MPSYQYMNCHCGGKTMSRPPYLNNGIHWQDIFILRQGPGNSGIPVHIYVIYIHTYIYIYMERKDFAVINLISLYQYIITPCLGICFYTIHFTLWLINYNIVSNCIRYCANFLVVEYAHIHKKSYARLAWSLKIPCSLWNFIKAE